MDRAIPRPTFAGRFGLRADLGGFFPEDAGGFIAVANFQVVHPIGSVVEVIASVGLPVGIAAWPIYGVTGDLGARFVLGRSFFLEAGGNLAGINTRTDSYATCGYDSFTGDRNECDDFMAHIRGLFGFGFYLDESRLMAVGANARLGIFDGHTRSFDATTHFTLLWPGW